MKLYRKRERKIEGPVSPVSDKPLESTQTYYEEVSPADLDKMNLTALGVWKELRARVVATLANQTLDISQQEAVARIMSDIESLESAADLKVPEVLVQAKAWEIMAPRLDKMDEFYKELGVKVEALTSEKVLAQARAELATEKGEKDGKS